MAVFKFPYTTFSCAPSQAFPKRTRVRRPVVHTVLHYGAQYVPVLALMDSGADDCIFPYSVGIRLGLKVEEGLLQTFSGAGSGGNRAYFHPVKMVIGERLRLYCPVGFTKAMDDAGLGLLGQTGFFDRLRVTFDYRCRLVLLKSSRS